MISTCIKLDEQAQQTLKKHICSLCEILPDHVEKWNSDLQGAKDSLQIVIHSREQYQAVWKARLDHVPNYEKTKPVLLFYIAESIEENWTALQNNITSLFKSMSVLTKRIYALEKCYSDSFSEPGDYSSDPIVSGTPTFPSLPTLLEESFKFHTYFAAAVDNIQKAFRSLQVYGYLKGSDSVGDKYCEHLQASLDVNLNHRFVTNLIELTQ